MLLKRSNPHFFLQMIQVVGTGLHRAYAPLRERIQVIKQKHGFDADWLNYLVQMLMYDEVIVPHGTRLR
jgi:hypothetical protein